MSYEKNEWQTGDTITAEKLNHMEDGIAGGGGVLVVEDHYDEQTGLDVLDHTWQEINGAPVSVVLYNGNPQGKTIEYVSQVILDNGTYKVVCMNTDLSFDEPQMGFMIYTCESADGYPSVED